MTLEVGKERSLWPQVEGRVRIRTLSRERSFSGSGTESRELC